MKDDDARSEQRRRLNASCHRLRIPFEKKIRLKKIWGHIGDILGAHSPNVQKGVYVCPSTRIPHSPTILSSALRLDDFRATRLLPLRFIVEARDAQFFLPSFNI
jgi:hypothetical protein